MQRRQRAIRDFKAVYFKHDSSRLFKRRERSAAKPQPKLGISRAKVQSMS